MKKLLLILFLFLLSIQIQAQSTDIDKDLGKQNAQSVEDQYKVYKSGPQNEYIQKVGARLVKSLDKPLFDYQFHLVEDMAPNAFALPGGYIYVTTGLIPILESEDELACILGHEIIHSNNRHTVKQLKKSILPSLLEIPGNLLGIVSEDLGSLFNAPIKTSNALLFASYSRKFESEADDEGVELAAKAGYDPAAMIGALSRLSSSVEVATSMEESKSYFNDHPYTPDRTAAINKKMQELHFKHTAAISNNFLAEFDGLIFGNNPDQGIIKENHFLHPEMDFYMEFPTNWKIDNQTSAVGAVNPENDAMVILTLDNPELTPKQASDEFMKNLKSQYKVKLVNKKSYKHNNKDSYKLEFVDEAKKRKMFGMVAWIPMNNMLFKVMTITPYENKNKVEKSIESLRNLNLEEKNSLTINRLHIVKAKGGETIKELSKREKNILNLDLTTTINDIDENEKLRKGEQVKIVIEEHYNYQYTIK